MPTLNIVLLQDSLGAGFGVMIWVVVVTVFILGANTFFKHAKKFDTNSSEAIGSRALAKLFTVIAVIIVLFFVVLFISDIEFM